MGRIKFWHIAVSLISLAVLVSFLDGFKYQGAHIARVDFSDIITTDTFRHQMLLNLAQDENVKAVIIHINSPGGGAYASEEIYEDLRTIGAKKPVMALMGSVAASGGYVIALGADRIFARPTTITGSIGVIFQWVSVKGLAKKIGIQPHVVRSGALKAKPDFFEPPSPKTRRHIEGIVQQLFTWFIDLVATRRNIKKADLLKKVGDGRIFTGTQALKINLIDEIGGETEARQWLAAKHAIALEMPVESYKPIYPDEGLRDWLFSSTMQALGLGTATKQLKPAQAQKDGLSLLWKF